MNSSMSYQALKELKSLQAWVKSDELESDPEEAVIAGCVLDLQNAGLQRC